MNAEVTSCMDACDIFLIMASSFDTICVSQLVLNERVHAGTRYWVCACRAMKRRFPARLISDPRMDESIVIFDAHERVSIAAQFNRVSTRPDAEKHLSVLILFSVIGKIGFVTSEISGKY